RGRWKELKRTNELGASHDLLLEAAFCAAASFERYHASTIASCQTRPPLRNFFVPWEFSFSDGPCETRGPRCLTRDPCGASISRRQAFRSLRCRLSSRYWPCSRFTGTCQSSMRPTRFLPC